MRIVIALGGNALLRRGQRPDAATQRANAAVAGRAVAAIALRHDVVVTHGNGPQIGLLALQNEASPALPSYPFDVLGAESEGMIGYLIEQELAAALPEREFATLLTQVVVDAGDAAFATPTKPIGPVYDEPTARRLAGERGWRVAQDGQHWRRVVASPEPRRIVEIAAVKTLLAARIVTICVGGGGIPVAVDEQGALRGVDAVIDKDLAAALLAIELEADRLLLLTDVAAVADGWGTATPRAIRQSEPAAMRRRRFAPGSMAPKVEAACRFAERGGEALIGALDEAPAVLAREAGTSIRAGARELMD